MWEEPRGFRGEEGHVQGNEKSRCSVIRSLPCPIDRSKKLFLVITPVMGKATYFSFLILFESFFTLNMGDQ